MILEEKIIPFQMTDTSVLHLLCMPYINTSASNDYATEYDLFSIVAAALALRLALRSTFFEERMTWQTGLPLPFSLATKYRDL